MPYCTDCGAPAASTALYCTECGQRLATPAPAPSSPLLDGNGYDLGMSLLDLSDAGDVFTLDDATRGVLIMGGTGSGKTSASGRQLALSYLVEGFGFLVLCAKPDEVQLWRDYAYLADREDDLRVIEANGPHCFNFLEAERARVGDSAAQLATVLNETVNQIAASESGQSREGEAFWKNELTKLCENTLETAMLAGQATEMATLARIVTSAPATSEEYDSEEWQAESLCGQCMLEAALNVCDDPEAMQDWKNLQDYWREDWAALDERTRGPIRSSFTTLSRVFNRRPLRRLLASETTLSPADIFDGKIVVVGLDLAGYGVDGRICNFVWKQAFQRAVLARKQKGRPVCLWADEAQTFIDSKDADYQARCRSALGCTVYLGHSPAMFGKMIPGGNSDKAVEGFLGNLQTKILHQNASPDACKFFSALFGKRLITEIGGGINTTQTGDTGTSTHAGKAERDVLPAIKFMELRTGGAENNYIVEAYIRKSTTPKFQASGDNWLKLAIVQTQYTPEGWQPPPELAKVR